jgi:hypothetical protein
MLQQSSVGAVLDNYADAIEGGNERRGSGSLYPGIPGVLSHDELAGTEVTATGGTVGEVVCALAADLAARLVREDGPSLFLECTSGTNAGIARRILAHDGDDTFTVQDFPDAVQGGDVFAVSEGFRRMPDNIETMSEDTDGRGGGFDRHFRLALMPGRMLDWYGDGVQLFESQLEVVLRFAKRGADTLTRERALVNALRIRSHLVSGELRDGTYTQSVVAIGGAPRIDDRGDHVEITDELRLVYKVNSVLR